MRNLLGLVVCLCVGLGLTSCAGNPVATATKAAPEYKAATVAYALYGSYVIVARQAVTIAEDSTTPRVVVQALVAAHDQASPAAKKLRQAADNYSKVRDAYVAQETTLEKVTAAAATLAAIVDETAPKLQALSTEVGGAQ